MKVYLSRYYRICLPIYGLIMIGSLLASILIVEVSMFQKVTACTVNVLATWAYIKVLVWDRCNFLMTAHIGPDYISSNLLWKECCVIRCDQLVYLFFFREFVEMGPPELPYIAISNGPVTFDATSKKLLSFNRRRIIILPDTEKVRSALVHCIHNENRREQNNPPPIEALRKKKKQDLPVVKRKNIPEGPPPFTGKWDGRF